MGRLWQAAQQAATPAAVQAERQRNAVYSAQRRRCPDNMLRHPWFQFALMAVGICLTCAVIVAHAGAIGYWQIVAYAGASLVLFFAYRLQTNDSPLSQLQTIRAQIAADEQRLEYRERALNERLLTYNEWMEFPDPIDLRITGSIQQNTALSSTEISAERTGFTESASHAEQGALAKKDRELNELLEAETKQLFEHIRCNKYGAGNRVQLDAIREDAHRLVSRVAHLYQPDVENPLLETNLSLVIRAASRCCLQFLTIIETLPVNVSDRSINSLYQLTRNAVEAFRLYRVAEPYMPYMKNVMYLSRLALGANPVSLGTWWFVQTFGQKGAQAVATRLVNRRAILLLRDLVRTVGLEVASIYGGEIRYRDANWLYAVELVELSHKFPLSRESLSRALQEIGALKFRSEYDRLFFYRCLAAHDSSHPERFHARAVLSQEERHSIATRLEKFLELHVHGKRTTAVNAWRQEVEKRLAVKLIVSAPRQSLSEARQRDEAIRSLASFLLGAKEREPLDLANDLATCASLRLLSEQERMALLERLEAEPPFYFEYADLDPESSLVSDYLDDLATLHASCSPRGRELEDAVMEVAAYLRADAKDMRRRLNDRYLKRLKERFSPGTTPPSVSPVLARTVLDLLEPQEQVRFLYSRIKADGTAENEPSKKPLWLLGAGKRAILFAEGEDPELVWQGNRDFQLKAEKGYLSSSYVISGGTWIDRERFGPTFRVPAALATSFKNYFRPLELMLDE